MAVLLKNKLNEQHSLAGSVSVAMGTVTMEIDDTDDVKRQTSQYTVQAIIKQKIVFVGRPKPIISNVPKKI